MWRQAALLRGGIRNMERNIMTTSSSRTYSGVGYDVTYFARKHRISKQDARALMRKYGHNRDQLNDAAIALSTASNN
jgi:hypothetical protein